MTLDLPEGGLSGYGVVGFVAALVVIMKLSQPSKFDAIPTAGSTTWLGSWWAGFKFFMNARDVIRIGYEEHKRSPFKIAVFYRWMVILCSREHVEELRKTPDDELSFLEGANYHLQVEYTMGPAVHHNPYHIPIVRSRLTRNLGAMYPEIRDEIVTTLNDILDLRGNEWKSVPASSSVLKVICRTTNRMCVGLPLCRDPDWINLNIENTLDIVKGGLVIKPFPAFLKPLVIRLFTRITQSKQHGKKLLGPIIEERRRYLNEYGNQWADKPNDLLSWLMEEAEGPELTIESLTTRMFAVNFAAVHTSSMSFTHALLYLAANPRYTHPLREEVEAIIDKEGWSKAALGKMRKVDSFLKECQRMEGLGGASLVRMALKNVTLSGGTLVPEGTIVAAAAGSIHYDEALYPNAHVFEPFRFAELRKKDGEGVKHQYVSTTPEYLAFGYGPHACPGRFFAANELKTMLAHIVVTYDIKLEDGTTRPQTLHIGTSNVPDPSAKVMFRRRVD